MEPHSVQRFGVLLAAICAGCSAPNAPNAVPQQQLDTAAMTVRSSATASSSLTGTATSCSDFYRCVYAISDSQGTGSASTSDDYPLNTIATYQLPGEAASTTSQPFTTTILGNVGTTYHLSGSFTSIDVNTEKVVKGKTNDYIIRTQHCFRTCTYSYSLSSGKISFNLTALDATATTLVCNPTTFPSGGSTKCTASVVDLANAANVPVGGVVFAAGQIGTFTPAKCYLSSGRCTVKFTPADDSVDGITMNASYAGNATHYKSAGSTVIDVTPN